MQAKASRSALLFFLFNAEQGNVGKGKKKHRIFQVEEKVLHRQHFIYLFIF